MHPGPPSVRTLYWKRVFTSFHHLCIMCAWVYLSDTWPALRLSRFWLQPILGLPCVGWNTFCFSVRQLLGEQTAVFFLAVCTIRIHFLHYEHHLWVIGQSSGPIRLKKKNKKASQSSLWIWFSSVLPSVHLTFNLNAGQYSFFQRAAWNHSCETIRAPPWKEKVWLTILFPGLISVIPTFYLKKLKSRARLQTALRCCKNHSCYQDLSILL